MTSLDLFALRATGDPLRWRLDLTHGLCAGGPDDPYLFGGTGLAAAITAMEYSAGRPALWATAQYLSYARPPAMIDIAVTLPAVGRGLSQASATLSIEGRPIIVAIGALGVREAPVTDQWIAAPDAPGPLACPQVRHRDGFGPGMESRMELRLAKGRFPTDEMHFDGRGDGTVLLWARLREGQPVSTQSLAVIADYMSVACSHAAGRYTTGNSIDNSIRFLTLEQSEWVLCRIQAIGAASGIIVIEMVIFSDRGLLMAQASTTLILRHG